MTDSEAIIIAKIMLTADNWCSACSDNLISQFQLAFGGHDAMIQSVKLSRDDLRRSHYQNEKDFSEGKSSLLPVWEL